MQEAVIHLSVRLTLLEKGPMRLTPNISPGSLTAVACMCPAGGVLEGLYLTNVAGFDMLPGVKLYGGPPSYL